MNPFYLMREMLGPRLCRQLACGFCCIFLVILFVLLVPFLGTLGGWAAPVMSSKPGLIGVGVAVGLLVLLCLGCWVRARCCSNSDDDDSDGDDEERQRLL